MGNPARMLGRPRIGAPTPARLSPVPAQSSLLCHGGDVEKIITGIAGTITGSIGWWLASSFGIMTAFIVSTIATGFGAYYGRKFAREILP